MVSTKHSPSSRAPALDRLSPLLARFRVRAHLFHSGPLCGMSRFDAQPGRAFLHVLRTGELLVTHPQRLRGLPRRVQLREPSVLFYPRAVRHVFHNPPRDGSGFTCATLDFDGGEQHPLVATLPPLLVVPLAQAPGLAPALALLFAETDALRCGSRLLADRLFEVVLIQLLRWLLDHPRGTALSPGLVRGLADPHLARALVALHAQPGAAWSLARLAQEAALSSSAFAAAFKAATGMTPMAHLADWRVSLACTGLRDGRPLKALAGELGYGSAAALAKAFKQRLGCAPRDWLAARRA